MLLKFLLVVQCIAISNIAIAQNNAPISTTIFENYKKGAGQFVVLINYLLAGVDKTKPVEWAQQLKKNVETVPVYFQASLTESESEKAKLDQSMIDMVARGSEMEVQIAQLQSAINANQALVNNYENEVSLASQHVQSAEKSVATSEHQVRELEEKLRKAREDCFLRRRRVKRCWPRWLCKVLCEALNWINDSIDDAKAAVSHARGTRDHAVNVLNQRRGQLDSARHQLSSSQNELARKQADLAGNTHQLNDLRAQIVSVSAINQGLKSVIEHVDRILAGSSLLKQFVGDLSLIDLNTLIEPLERIGRELISSTPGTEAIQFPTLSQEQITAIQSSLKTLSQQLPNEDIITNNVAHV